jgi:hypothetical protein
MKRHPELGAEKIAKLRDKFPDNPWYDMLISVIRYHHERYDGQGYPEGLKKRRDSVCRHGLLPWLMFMKHCVPNVRTNRVFALGECGNYYGWIRLSF